jgi:tetratricopeptide (TPR) repeat protein
MGVKAGMLAVFISVLVGTAQGQMIMPQCPPGAPTDLQVSGRIIAPGVTFDSYIEVIQLIETQPVGYGYTNSTGEFTMPEQPIGQYYIVVRIDGFKEYRDRINVAGCEKSFRYVIFMEPEEEKILPLLLDFSGEVNEVVDVAELKRTFPKKAIDEYEKARSERLRGEPSKAQARLEKVIRDYPEFYNGRNELGTIYLEKKMFREAELEFNAAHDLRPASAAPLVSLGSLYVQEAEAGSNPESGSVGVLLLESDLAVILDDARSALEQAIQLKPDASFAHYLLGVTHYKAGRLAEAEASLHKALEVESRLRWARIALGNTYIRQQRWKDALSQFDAYLKEFPKVSNRGEVEQIRKKVLQNLSPSSD